MNWLPQLVETLFTMTLPVMSVVFGVGFVYGVFTGHIYHLSSNRLGRFKPPLNDSRWVTREREPIHYWANVCFYLFLAVVAAILFFYRTFD